MTTPSAASVTPTTENKCSFKGQSFAILKRRDWTHGKDGIIEFVVASPLIARQAQAGQFVIVRTDQQGERIPLTIAAYDREAGTINLIFQMVGFSTRRMGALHEGDSLLDVLGPLGTPVAIKRYEKPVVCIGGGIGIAPILPKVKELFAIGNEVITIIGARSKDVLILEDELRSISTSLHVTTDDGSLGRKGFVTEVLKDVLAERENQLAEVIAVGPLPMMEAVVKTMTGKMVRETYNPATEFDDTRIPCIVSLNPIMVDGTGMCGGCRVQIWDPVLQRNAPRFACVDGPAFDGYTVDFESLMKRNQQYHAQEKVADKNE